MRLRLALLATAFIALGSFVIPGAASAAPKHNHHLTISSTPNPVIAGQGVLIYGQLKGPDSAGQVVRLYHHLADAGPGYTLIGTTTTNTFGFYEFTRQEEVVETNRSWFVTGPDGSHSRTISERVAPLVSLTASTTSTDTSHRVVFTGSVDPNHAFERVYLQAQTGNSDDWHTLTSTQLGADSHYAMAYRFRVPGQRDLRVLFRGDRRNIRGASDIVSVTVQQTQVPGFTINSSDPVTPAGSSVTISGVLDQAGSTAPEPNTPVELWGHAPDQPGYKVLATGTTGSDGSYSFSQSNLSENAVYYVSTVHTKGVKTRRTAALWQGVQDVVTMQASASAVQVGQSVTFSGTVSPVKADHVIYLQTLGKDGEWHNVQVGVTNADGSYQFTQKAGEVGTYKFRARIFHDEKNVGAGSPPVSVTVTPAPASSLPPAS